MFGVFFALYEHGSLLGRLLGHPESTFCSAVSNEC